SNVIPVKHVNLIIKGSAPLISDTSLKLERVLDVPARVWNALEANYQGHLSRLNETQQLEQHLDWASKELVRELVRRHCIANAPNRVDQLREVLRFFGVASVAAWNAV